jgi:hypothetical protein
LHLDAGIAEPARVHAILNGEAVAVIGVIAADNDPLMPLDMPLDCRQDILARSFGRRYIQRQPGQATPAGKTGAFSKPRHGSHLPLTMPSWRQAAAISMHAANQSALPR